MLSGEVSGDVRCFRALGRGGLRNRSLAVRGACRAPVVLVRCLLLGCAGSIRVAALAVCIVGAPTSRFGASTSARATKPGRPKRVGSTRNPVSQALASLRLRHRHVDNLLHDLRHRDIDLGSQVDQELEPSSERA